MHQVLDPFDIFQSLTGSIKYIEVDIVFVFIIYIKGFLYYLLNFNLNVA